jgi:hypothetical protein
MSRIAIFSVILILTTAMKPSGAARFVASEVAGRRWPVAGDRYLVTLTFFFVSWWLFSFQTNLETPFGFFETPVLVRNFTESLLLIFGTPSRYF